MAYQFLNLPVTNEHEEENGLKAALRFIREDCEGLRFDREIDRQEKETGKYFGKSISPDQIPYNMEKEIDQRCLELAVERFLNSGSSMDAFDVYFCWLDMYTNSQKARSMIELLSEYEKNGSALLMKHRDHYSHSCYVFCLGLAIYKTNEAFRKAYVEYYGIRDAREAAHHFLKYWGLTSLFHDTGYCFELPFEQVEAYYEMMDEKRVDAPYISYQRIEHYTRIPDELRPALERLFPGKAFSTINEMFAEHICRVFGNPELTPESLTRMLDNKPTHPEMYHFYMDHAWFSACMLFRNIFAETQLILDQPSLDALTAIILHNSLFKFVVGVWDKQQHPLRLHTHPLTYLLMLCDELQCWDRTSYGRNSRSDLQPMDCHFSFSGNRVAAAYQYDENEKYKMDRFNSDYRNWMSVRPETENGDNLSFWRKSRPRVKTCSDMLVLPDGSGNPQFIRDLGQIVSLQDIPVTICVEWTRKASERKQMFLSESSFIHLYNFAVALNGRWMMCGEWKKALASGLEEQYFAEQRQKCEAAFNALSLEYKLSNINQAKAFARYLNSLNCFFTDRDVSYDLVDCFTENDMHIIGPMEHERWLREHIEMGWHYGQPENKAERERKRIHPDMVPDEMIVDGSVSSENALKHYLSLAPEEQEKDTEPQNMLLQLIRIYDGLRIYRLDL